MIDAHSNIFIRQYIQGE